MNETVNHETTNAELARDSLALFQHVIRFVNQLPVDWSHIGGLEPGQEADDAYRFQLSAMVMMLATVQYHLTPAYKELCRTAIEKMIDQADTPPNILNKALRHERVG